MDSKSKRSLTTARQHRKDFWWQILLPILVFVVLLGLALYLALGQGSASYGNLAQVGTILMLFPLLLVVLVFFFILIVLIYLLAVLMQRIPPNAYWLQKQFQRLNMRVQEASEMLTRPIQHLGRLADSASQFLSRMQ